MALISTSEHHAAHRRRSGNNIEPLVSGLLIGLATLGFAACMVLVLTGKAGKWIHKARATSAVQSAVPDAGMK